VGEVNAVWGILLASGFFPLYRAWRASLGSPLRHALAWAALAWSLWCLAAWQGGDVLSYLALSLTACAGVAVLGARRPGVAAWDFVVLGLLAALSRPFLEGLGELRLETAHVVFLGVGLGVGVANYLPTRQAAAAACVGIWCAVELRRLTGVDAGGAPAAKVLLVLAPWLAWLCSRPPGQEGVTALWLSFRDQFGFLWGQRIREQFNRAAENAGLPVHLGWGGLRAEPGADTGRAADILRAALKRFGSP
jgi:hypothetical protein